MKCHDFSYDGIRLSDFGYMICRFDSGGIDTTENGSIIEFNTVPSKNGQQHYLVSSQYSDTVTAVLQICKSQCDVEGLDITVAEQREIMRWLNSRTFKKLRFIDVDGEYARIYYNASFNVSKIEVDGRVIGFELEVFTDRPYALQDDVVASIKNDRPGEVRSYYSESDETGYLYPKTEIAIHQDGDLVIHSLNENRDTVIRNCKNGEVITLDYPMAFSSDKSHKINNDFNWIFYRVVNTFNNAQNKFTASLPCDIDITYAPVVKIGI